MDHGVFGRSIPDRRRVTATTSLQCWGLERIALVESLNRWTAAIEGATLDGLFGAVA